MEKWITDQEIKPDRGVLVIALAKLPHGRKPLWFCAWVEYDGNWVGINNGLAPFVPRPLRIVEKWKPLLPPNAELTLRAEGTSGAAKVE